MTESKILIAEQWNTCLVDIEEPNKDVILPLDIPVMATTMKEEWGPRWELGKIYPEDTEDNWYFILPSNSTPDKDRFLSVDIDITVGPKSYFALTPFLLKGAHVVLGLNKRRTNGKLERIETVYRPSAWYTASTHLKVNIGGPAFNMAMRDALITINRGEKIYLTLGVYTEYEKAWSDQFNPRLPTKGIKCTFTTLSPVFPDPYID